jgi:hypothetical protein
MNPIVKNILAVITGIVIGGLVNSGILAIGSSIIPPPEGVDLKSIEGLKAAMPLMEPKHFVMPFLAHALGTFAGALLTALIAFSHKLRLAMLIGLVFLVGGIAMVLQLPSPIWFTCIDLGLAYIPMAYLAHKLAERRA